MDEDEEKKEIRIDENYTRDGEDAYADDDSDLDFLGFFKSATKYFKYTIKNHCLLSLPSFFIFFLFLLLTQDYNID